MGSEIDECGWLHSTHPQGLFEKVVLCHSLGSIWSYHDKKGKEQMAPTIHAIVTKINLVTKDVIATCPGNHRIKATARARVVMH